MTTKNDMVRSNPFPGLRAFRPEEGHLFFGRIESTSKVVNRLIENRFVAVIGASGSGKSSLVLSGVIPSLLQENEKGKKIWSYIVIRPALNPIDNLAGELSALSAGAAFTYMPTANVAASLHNRSEGIIDIVNKIRKNLRQQIVIVIDQFEEIFRYSPASTRGYIGDEATDFIDLLVNAAQQPDQGLYLILTLRSEYVSECSRFHSLTNLLNSGSYLLPQLTRETLGTVIEEPVKISGATIDRGLVRTIISDLGDKSGQLPVLQHLLMRLWSQWSKCGDLSRSLSMADYEAIGRMKGAISQHAGQAFNTLDDRHKYVCSRMFRSITVRTDDGKEIRKPERISTIASLTGCDEQELTHVAEVFRMPEYSFITPVKEIPLSSESIIDLSHESIIRLWDTLKKWLDDEEASKRLYLQLASAAALNQEGNGKLWGPPELQMAIKWRNENNPTLAWAEKLDPAFERTMLFLKNSEEEFNAKEEYNKKAGKKKIKRSRLFAGILGLIVIITLAALGTALSLKSRAEKQKTIALKLKDDALAINDRLTDSLEIISDTLKLAEGEINAAHTTMLAAMNRVETADQKVAMAGRLIKEAESGKEEAIKKAAEEKRGKMISIAKSLAIRSLNHAGEKDLQILLALQGYIFNKRYAGAPNDADIYSAFYDVSKNYGNRYYSQFVTDGIVVTAMAEDPSGDNFYTADNRGRVLQWQADNPDKGYDVIWTGVKVIETMTVSPDATWLACGTATSEIIMIPLSSNSIGYQMTGTKGSITALIFTKSGNTLWSATLEGKVAEWDLTTRTCKDISSSLAGVTAIDISPDNSLLAGLTTDGKVVVCQIDSGNKFVILDLGDKHITSLRFVPWDERLVTGDEDGTIEVWNATEKRIADNFQGHDSPITHIAFNTFEKQMVTTGEEGVIKLWSMTDLKEPPAIITDSGESLLHIGFTNDGKALLTASAGSVTLRPSQVEYMTPGICSKVTRNLTPDEWSAFVGRDIEYEKSCQDKSYQIRVNEIRMGQ